MQKKKLLLTALPVAACIAALGMAAPAALAAGADGSGAVSYQANLTAISPNTPAGAASGKFMLTLKGDQATISEQVKGLADKLPTDKATLTALGIPTAFAGAAFPHVQHIHINGQNTCPTASADTNKDGVISTVEGQPAYGGIGTTLSVKGSTAASAATDVTVAPGGANFTLNRTFTINQATLSAIKGNNAVIVVHGLNPTNAPKASLTTANSLGVTLPGASKKLALIGTAPALCGKLMASQMNTMPSGPAQTGAGTTSGTKDLSLLYGAGALLLGAGAALEIRRRYAKQN